MDHRVDALSEPSTIRWPVQLSPSGSVAVCDQLSTTGVIESVARIGSVELGSLVFAPEVGLPALELLSATPEPDQVAAMLEAQEPDAVVRVTRMPDVSRGEGWDQLRVEIGVAGEDSGGV